MKQKNFLKWGFFILLGLVTLVMMANYLKLARQRKSRSKAEEKPVAGYSPIILADNYGKPETSQSQGAVKLAAGETAPQVQNLQPPTVSGFSSDLFTGGATVNYPLDLPPGKGGLTPSLSLNYSSHNVYGPVMGADVNGDGTHNNCDIVQCDHTKENWSDNLIVQSSQIGLGWDINGIGSILRDSTGQFTLILNGQSYRLFKSTEETDWHTNPISFLKINHQIKFNDEFEDKTALPENFEITDTNGTVYIFEPKGYFWRRCEKRSESGYGACQQATEEECNKWGTPGAECEKWVRYFTKWVLSKILDVSGNEIKVVYDIEEGIYEKLVNAPYPRAINLSEINYSGSGEDFNSKIEFLFANREDWKNLRWGPGDANKDGQPDESGGQTFFSTKRIAIINVLVKQGNDWKIVRQYEIDNTKYFNSAYRSNQNCQDPNTADPNDEGRCPLHLKLTSITARGKDAAQKLPSYKFTYFEDADQWNVNNYRLLKTAENGYGGKVEYNYQAYNISDFSPKKGLFWGTVYGGHRITQKIISDQLTGTSIKTTYEYPLNDTGVGVAEEYHADFESVGHSRVAVKLYKKNSEDVLNTTVYEFNQGQYFDDGDCQGRFFVWPERGQVTQTAVFAGDFNASSDIDLNKSLSYSQTDYLREKSDGTDDRQTSCTGYKDNQDAIWNKGHFIATKETRSCQDPTSQWPKGNKTTYHYQPEDQNDQQWGNLTQTTEYIVNNCDYTAASAYRSTRNTYFPNTNSHITNRVAETETFTCETDPQTKDCLRTKRLAVSWNIYDENPFNDPKKTPGSKGLLTASRAFYTFPEAANATVGGGSEDTVDTKYEYYDFGALKSTTTYDGYGSSSLSTAGSGTVRTSTIAYDDTYNTFPVMAKNPLSHTSETFYKNGAELVNHPYLADRTVSKDVNGQLWTTVVDGFGRSKESYFPADTVGETPARAKIEYNDVGKDSVDKLIVHIQTRDDKDEATSSATYLHGWQFYNGLGQLIESQTEKEGDGAKITLTAQSYNALGQVEKALLAYEAANGGTFLNPDWTKPKNETFYDALGRAIKSVASGNRVTETGYYGHKTAVLDPNKHLATTEVDNLGRTINTRVFKGNRSLATPDDYYTETKFVYDYLNRLTKTIDAKGNIAENFYNQFGQKIETKDPDLGNWKYAYYPTGQLKTVTDAKLQVKSFVYDKLDRIKFKYYGDTDTGRIVASFLYDDTCQNGVGRLCSELTSNQPEDGFVKISTLYNYDIKGRLISQIKRIEDTNYITNFAYDAAGRQKTIIYPDGSHEQVNYSYNDAGLLNNVAGAQTYLTSAKHNTLGMPEEEVFGNQTKNTYVYEPNTFRLAEKTVKKNDTAGTLLWSQKLAYDPVGNITDITYPFRKDFPGLPFKIAYTYDDLNRLTGGQIAGLTEEAAKQTFYTKYAYDELGRMTFKQEEGEDKSCKKVTVNNVNRNSALVAENLSETEKGYISFDFFDKKGRELFFVGDSVKPKNESNEVGKRSYVPILVDALSDIRSKYPNYEGYVIVESHKKTDYPGRQDGPCIKVLSGTPQELCQINPQRYSFFCSTPTPTIIQ